MSYIESNLIPGEEIAIFRKPSSSEKTASVLFAILAVVSLIFGVVVLTVIFAFAAAVGYFRWSGSEYAITNKRVIVKTWAFSTVTNEISMLKVESVSMKKSMMVNLGDVIVKWSGWQEVIFRAVDNPQEIRDFLFKEIEKRS